MNYLNLNEDKVDNTVKHLNRLLSNYHIYYQNLRNAHWNVQGQNFFELHNTFEELYDDARLKIDDIAERVLTLRRVPTSRMSDYLKKSSIGEAEILKTDSEMVDMILNNHEVLITNMREVIEAADKSKDEGTIDMVGGFLGNIEKKSWMLDAWRTRKLETVHA